PAAASQGGSQVAGVAPLPKAPGSSAQYSAIGGAFEDAVLAAAQSAREGRGGRSMLPPEPELSIESDSDSDTKTTAVDLNAAEHARSYDAREEADEAISGALGALEQLERLPTARLPAVEESEPEVPARPPAYLSKPPPGAGRYSSLREGEGDEIEPDTKRVRQQRTSSRPRRSVRPEPVSPTADTQTTLRAFESPLPPEPTRAPSPRPSKPPPGTGLYRSSVVSSEVISLSPPLPVGAKRSSHPPGNARRSQRPAAAPSAPNKRTSSAPPADKTPARRSSKRPPPPDDRRNTPLASPAAEFVTPPKALRGAPQQPEATVIVDTLGQTRALVDDLCKCGPDDEGPTVQSLLRVGNDALDVLIERFPGPLWFDRRRPYARLPFGRDTGPIARALAAFGSAALARIHPLLRSTNPDVRYYATLFLSDQVHPDLLVPIAERLFDDDPQIRLMVRDTLPAYRHLPAFVQVLGSLRTRMLEARAALPARLAAIDALTHLRDGQSVLPLVELLAHPDRQLTVPAHRALVTITCQDFGSSTKKWRAWFEENQHRHRVQWLIDSLMHSEQNLRSAAGIELQKVTQVYYGYVASAPKRDRERAQRRYQDWWENEGHKRF
ncbi:MAG TPA: hypothetical protein VJR89_18650, partial [Polyangiales bacterium]|nr:hypothetical protein [Polyangiales bacterium]